MLRSFDKLFAPVTWIVAAVFGVMLLVGPQVIAEDKPGETSASVYGGGGGGSADGAAVFKDSCGSCHTLSAAGTSGQVGPNLDGSSLGADEIEAIVRDGRGTMPSFDGDLSDAEIKAVAAYVEASR